MGMHPKFNDEAIFLLSDLIFSSAEGGAINKLLELNLIDQSSVHKWEVFLSETTPGKQGFAKLVDKLKLQVDPIVAVNGYISVASPLAIVNNIISALRVFDEDRLRYQNIHGLTALDFGSGVYRPLSVALIFLANGFKKVFAYEPYPIKPNFACASALEAISQIMQYPGKFNFSGISEKEMLSNLARVDFRDLSARMSDFSSGVTSSVDLGSIQLINNFNDASDCGVDLIFSNAVLEHVEEFDEQISLSLGKLSRTGACIHIVDFLDHRYYDDNTLHPYEKYYDGVLDEINGLLPSEMESSFLRNGFNFKKIEIQSVPVDFFNGRYRAIIDRFSRFPVDELRQHVNAYFLTSVN